MEHLEVKTAFLNAPEEENVWVVQVPGFEETDPHTGVQLVLKLPQIVVRIAPKSAQLDFLTPFPARV